MRNSLIVVFPEQVSFSEAQKVAMNSINASNHIKTVRSTALYKQIANHSLSLSDLWILLATALVYTMHFGFATLGAVFSQVEINTKNLFEIYTSLLGVWRPVWVPLRYEMNTI